MALIAQNLRSSQLGKARNELDSAAKVASLNSELIVIQLASNGWFKHSAVIYRVDSSGGVVAGSRHSPISYGYWANYMLTSLLNKHYG